MDTKETLSNTKASPASIQNHDADCQACSSSNTKAPPAIVQNQDDDCKTCSSSTFISEMDTKAPPSNAEASLANVLNHDADFKACSTSNTGISNEFTNQGLILWTDTRQKWVTAGNQSPNRSIEATEPGLGWDADFDSLLRSNKPFPQPVPLSEIVDFLTDIWTQEADNWS